MSANLLIGLWLALITTGVLDGQGAKVVAGIVGMVLSAGFVEAVDVFGTNWRLTLAEKVGLAFDIEIAELSASLPSLEHHERADYYERLELLRQQHGALGSAMNFVISAANAIVAAIVTVVLLAIVHPLLLLTVLLVLPSIWVSSRQQHWQRLAEEASASHGRLARSVRRMAYDRNAGMEIRVLGLQNEISGRVRSSWQMYRRPLRRAEVSSAALGGLRELAFQACGVMAISFVFWRALQGQASAGDVVLTAYLSGQVQRSVLSPIDVLSRLGSVMRGVTRVRWLRRYVRSTLSSRASDRPAPDALRDCVAFEHVSFRYPGSNTWVLRDVSFRASAGDVLAIVGENGSGKTTIVKLLTGMYKPTMGRITVDGVDLSEISVDGWRSRLTAAFQDSAKLELTAQQAIGVGDLPRIDDEPMVLAAIARAGVADALRALPSGLSTNLGSSWPNGVDLSTGQWQKLALGRALMRDVGPEPLLLTCFDEPTASLDSQSEHALFQAYAAVARAGADRGMVTLLISHRFSTVRAADRILVIDGHRLVEEGSHEELMRADGLYAGLYRLQAQSYLH